MENKNNTTGNNQQENTSQNANNPYTASGSMHGGTGNPYDSENLDHESESESKDITEKDIEKDLIENDTSEGFETETDNPKDDAFKSGQFQTIEPDPNNPAHKEFEIGNLDNEALQEDELSRDETGHGALHNKPSQRKF